MCRVSLAAAFLLGLSGTAYAEEWRYCLASSADGKTVYLSNIVQDDTPLEKLQREFADALKASRYTFSGVQCPRGETSDSLKAAQAQTVAYQRGLGARVQHVAWPPNG